MSGDEAEAVLDAAVDALREGRAEEALRTADDALAIDPDLSRAHHVRSLALEQLKRIPEARRAAESAAALDPESPAIQEQLGGLLLDEQPARAEVHYRESLRRDSWDQGGGRRARVLNNLGVALTAQRKGREAALAFKAAHLLDPTLVEARQNARASIRNLVRGAAILVGIDLLLKFAKGGKHATKLEALRPYRGWFLGAMAVLVVAALGVWLWRRTAGMARLAGEEPELFALLQRLEAEKKQGREARR
jgi:Tfp pilus assembly protein PilF